LKNDLFHFCTNGIVHCVVGVGAYMVEAILLGIAQDGGRPQAGCNQPCCIGLSSIKTSYPTALGIISNQETHLIDVTRNLSNQLLLMEGRKPTHVWLTHAHFGHIDGLGLFGRETMNAKGVNLYASSRMKQLLDATPQWKLMLDQGVFEFHETTSSKDIKQTNFKITPIIIPHRDELSDMHAYLVKGPEKTLLYLPDHDTWKETLEEYECKEIREWFTKLNIDIALIDGTFWSADELKSRNQENVPHPPIKQTIEMLGYKKQGDPEVVFIHLNHTNPVYDEWGEEYHQVIGKGWKIGKEGMSFEL